MADWKNIHAVMEVNILIHEVAFLYKGINHYMCRSYWNKTSNIYGIFFFRSLRTKYKVEKSKIKKFTQSHFGLGICVCVFVTTTGSVFWMNQVHCTLTVMYIWCLSGMNCNLYMLTNSRHVWKNYFKLKPSNSSSSPKILNMIYPLLVQYYHLIM